MKLHFFLRFHTRFGQSLLVSGNIPELGGGDPSRAVALTYLNEEFWTLTIEIEGPLPEQLAYTYLLENSDGSRITEWGHDRFIDSARAGNRELRVIDTWNHAGEFENSFYTDPFQQVLLRKPKQTPATETTAEYDHVFRVKAPLLRKNEVLCLIGSSTQLGNWGTASPLLMHMQSGWWTAALATEPTSFPLSYKYGVYNVKTETFTRFEDGNNRVLISDFQPGVTYVHDGFAHLPNNIWKGAGVSIPVFSLRSKNSFGIGEFTDLRFLVDWAVKTELKLIQILPVNDTTATHTSQDSYPYAAISAFALHPIYVSLEEVAGKKYEELLKPLRKKQKELNALPEVSYEEVLKYKLAALWELFQLRKEQFRNEEGYADFFEKNKYWLIPYAAFCHLRDKNGTSDFGKWKTHGVFNKLSVDRYVSPNAKHHEEILFIYFIQYHLHLQLKEAADYAHKNGIILKGDIAIGVYRYGCDAWMEPELFHMDMQAGAPPDDFAPLGQNWGFPTYNWERMSQDGFQWWHRRFRQMSAYFDAFRIDHILGFFRIWSIPVESTQGIMGRFVPASPVHINEFGQRGIAFDHYRLCAPYITSPLLKERYGARQELLLPYLDDIGGQHYALKEAWSTQQKITEWFDRQEPGEANDFVCAALLDLASNIILFEAEGSAGAHFHFRFHMHHTASYRNLDATTQSKLYDLYVDYFFRRQDKHWQEEAMQKLPALKQSTNMLICGEDLGLVPTCVPEVMRQLGILSLEIQRMPKALGKEFFDPGEAPYLSVVTPSTHDMSTIRGWWEEDRGKAQRFYNNELGQQGEAPNFCEPWINRAVLVQHLYSPAMWSIFQLQDILGIDGSLRRKNPQEERINVPANARHIWNYRMHITLEQLLKEKNFNHDFRDLVDAAGRG